MDNLKPIKRPKPSDGEEDLYKMQDEFLKSHQQPSAKVINFRAENKQSHYSKAVEDDKKPPVKFKSKFAERRSLLKAQEKLSTSQIGGSPINSSVVTDDLSNIIKPCESLQDNIQDIPKEPSSTILGNIIERKITKINYKKTQEIDDNNGFPSVFVIDHNEKLLDNDKSFFSKSLASSVSSPQKNKIAESVVKQETVVVNSLLSDISQENQQRLDNMTADEIIEEKKKLENMLSPKMINFLKARSNKSKKIPQKAEEMEVEETSKDSIENTNNSIVQPPNEVVEIVEKANEKGWIHMDEVEQVKLEWMTDLPETKTNDSPPEEPYNARFDFDGMLLPFKDDNVAVNSGLHHHGDEPDRPGYSLQELLQLSRSSTQQQRCTAITTLGNIMDKSKKGLYDKVLEPAPLVALNSKNIFYLLRITIDDSSLAVVTAGLQALRSFLYNQADEICLDKLFGWKYDDGLFNVPELLPPKNDVDNYDELKDDEFVQLDVVGAAIRSDLILRIRFILSELKPPLVGVTAALEILTRLSRHSRKTALNIACTKNLLEIIVKNFIPLTNNTDDGKNAYGVPQLNAVRFCRVLLEYAGRPVADRLYNLKIINCLLSYTTCGSSVVGRGDLQLSIEALRLWKLILNYGIGKDSIVGARLMLGTQLQLLLSNHNIEGSSELTCEYAGLLVSLSYNEESLKPVINTLLTKWTTQLETIKSPTWFNSKLISTILTTFGDTLPLSCLKTNWLLNTNIYSKILMSSNLLSNCTQATDRDTTALPSLGAFTQNGELQPILSIKSSLLFLSTVVNIFNKYSMFNELKIIIENSDVIKYLNKLNEKEWKLTNNWFTRIELYLLTGIVKASTNIQLNESINNTILNIAIKLVSNLPSDATTAIKEMIKIIFTNEKLTVQKLTSELNHLKLNNNMSNCVLKIPDDISTIYEKYVSFGSWCTTGMPIDWPYLPLVAIYSCQKNNTTWNDNDTINIITLLSLELSMPELFNNLTPNLRFSRLILIYLCETIYLNENVSILMNQLMKVFLKNNHEKLDFSVDVPGISSFTDIFTSMCECFCANSYGDDGFSTVLLLPIAQRHDSHYRKLLWSEHAGSLRYLKIKPDNLLIPLDEYLYPLENDSSLIESYITALVRQTVKKNINPLMYLIALHHSANYLNSQTKIAIKMKSRIANIKDKNLLDELLNYSK